MALVDLAINAGSEVETLREQHPRLRSRDRAECRPYMTTLQPWKAGKHLLAVKGSPEEVLAMCEAQIRNGRRVRLSDKARDAIMTANDRMAGDALRVLGVAYRELDEDRMPRKTGKLVWLGLAGMADRRPNQLSGGQQQRVAIARAIVGKPRVLLADEPTGNLDSHMGEEVMGILEDLNRNEQTTVVMVTHDPRLAERTQTTIRLFDGRQVN